MKMRSLLVPSLLVLSLYSAGIAPAAGQTTKSGTFERSVFVPWVATSVWTFAHDLETSPLPNEVLSTLLQSSELHRAAVKRLREQHHGPGQLPGVGAGLIRPFANRPALYPGSLRPGRPRRGACFHSNHRLKHAAGSE